jgi:hypothetical protein
MRRGRRQQRCKPTHHHVVWQLGDDPRKDIVEPPRWKPFGSTTCNDTNFPAGGLRKITRTQFRWLPPEFCQYGNGGELLFDVDDFRCVAIMPGRLTIALKRAGLGTTARSRSSMTRRFKHSTRR